MKPICDVNPHHGEMQEEPMYGADGKTVEQYGWFCLVKNCDGYGGPVERGKKRAPATVEQKKIIESGQMELLAW